MAEDTRGRLSSIDLVPEHAQDEVMWALAQLNRRERTQEDIRFELNGRLAVKGVEPISRSAFNRKAVRLAAMKRRLDEARHIFVGVADQFTPEKVDESNIGIGEVLKMLIFELTDASGGEVSTKGAMELAKAYHSVISGQKLSAERRQKVQADYAKAAGAAVDAVAAEKGLSAETVEQIKAKILGVQG